MRFYLRAFFKIAFLLMLITGLMSAFQQEQKPEQKPDEKTGTAPPLSTSARLSAAKTAFLRRIGTGDDAAYNVVSTTLEGWGRFTLVNSLDKADVIVEIFSVSESEGGVSASAGGGERRGGRVGSTRPATPALIKLTIYDPKSRVPLWTGAEHPKSAMRKTDRENNEVEAAERLMQKFHDYLEPPGK